ncbi:MAG TPA: hypothetical protein VEG27_07080 [Usitatibacter sp.]|nr:hypothetical protein [Usitatibacter sp.]
MVSSRLFAGLLLASSSAAVAGLYDQPWSAVEPADASTVRKEFPASITQIDGRSTSNPKRSEAVAPGKHVVTIRFETARVNQSEAEATRELDLNLEPCTRYRIAARRTTGTKWEPQVYTEPISECARKFQKPAS